MTYSVKTVRFIASLIVVVLYANLALAQTVAQDAAGGGSEDVSSSNYQAKTAAADPGVGGSQSANYIYDHGTLWFESPSPEPTPSPDPDPAPVPVSSGGGNSGSGWLGGLFGGDPQIGGISPAVDVPFKDTPPAEAFVASVPQAKKTAVRIADAPQAVEYAFQNPQPVPQIIRLVDEKGVTREINIVLFKRIVPWPLWLAVALMAIGALVIIGFTLIRGAQEYLLWVGGACILVGVIGGVVIRFAYRSTPIDTRTITSINVVAEAEATDAVKKLMVEMPIGVHVVKAADAKGAPVLTVKVFITPALPI